MATQPCHRFVFEQRKVIQIGVAHRQKAAQIAFAPSVNPAPVPARVRGAGRATNTRNARNPGRPTYLDYIRFLAANNPCFWCFPQIEGGGDGRRANVFFCDSFVSNQKGSVDNSNGQLRRFFPRGRLHRRRDRRPPGDCAGLRKPASERRLYMR